MPKVLQSAFTEVSFSGLSDIHKCMFGWSLKDPATNDVTGQLPQSLNLRTFEA